ncbi:MAG: hypothetical protein BM565_06005 [Gammaproteobacteria bacterium MedPE]|nr:MAG: hypothetical protein BM565_06005 [Gammaproteobacteria bacterium MedPE]
MIKPLITGLVLCSTLIFNQVQATENDDPVSIDWIKPEKFRDVDSANSNKKRYRARVIKDLESYMQQQLPKFLNTGESITLKIYDLDLAGDIRPMMGAGNDIRVVKSIYPPMIDIEYALVDQQGKVIKGQRKRFRDIAFNMGSPMTSSKSLGYEKAMLKKWMRNELTH